MIRGTKIPPGQYPDEWMSNNICKKNLKILIVGREDLLKLRNEDISTTAITINDVINHTKKYILDNRSPIYDSFPCCGDGGTYDFSESLIPRCSYHGYSD